MSVAYYFAYLLYMDDAYAFVPFFKSRKAVPELDHAKFRSGAGSAVSDSDIGTVLSDI